MAIRKDLNDMLNSLRNDDGEKKKPESMTESVHRKSKYDDMSLDDLLNSLKAEKLEELNAQKESGPENSAETAAPEAVKPKHKKIVISKELPDYEAIRQRELEKDRAEKARLEAERLEKERLERERLEAERLEKERLERERLEAERLEKERLERERLEAERLEKERLERERLEAERLEKERLERERLEAERLEKERLERERLEAERSEAEEVPVQLDDDTDAEDLINSALESIRNDDAELDGELGDHEVQQDEDTQSDDGEADDTAEEDDTDDGSGKVERLIDGMREDAENAIADLEKPSAPAEEAPEEESVHEETEAEEAQEEPEKPKLIASLNKILDEDPNEIIDERSVKTEESAEMPAEKDSGKVKKRLYAVLGAVFSVFAVIGLITVIVKGVGFFRGFASGEVRKDGFTEVIYPEVIMDIESFNDPSELTSDQILTAAIWSIIMDDDAVAKYNSAAGTGIISIPDVDVEARAVELFGEDHPAFRHTTLGPVESKFFYSNGAYNVELRPVTFTYSPEITKIVKSGDDYTLTVDYVEELPEWIEKTVVKTAEYKLTKKEDGTYRINSMKILSKSNTNL